MRRDQAGTGRRRSTARGCALAAAVVAIGNTAASATGAAATATTLAFEDCQAAEMFLPAPRDAVDRSMPDEFEPVPMHAALLRAIPSPPPPASDPGLEREDADVAVFLRFLQCRGDDGRPVRSLRMGPVVKPRSTHYEGLQTSYVWRLHTDDPTAWQQLRSAIPSSDIRLVRPPDAFWLRFDDVVGRAQRPGPEPALDARTLTTFSGGLAGTSDAVEARWAVPAPRPLVHLPEVRGVQMTSYVSAGARLHRMVSQYPARGGNDPGGPFGDTGAALLNFRLGPATGEVTAGPGTRLAELAGTEGGYRSPATSVFTHVIGSRLDLCMEPVAAPDTSTACLPNLPPPRAARRTTHRDVGIVG